MIDLTALWYSGIEDLMNEEVVSSIVPALLQGVLPRETKEEDVEFFAGEARLVLFLAMLYYLATWVQRPSPEPLSTFFDISLLK